MHRNRPNTTFSSSRNYGSNRDAVWRVWLSRGPYEIPKFHRASQLGRASRGGEVPRSTQVDSCRFSCFYGYLLFLELVYRSESARESKFFAIPLVHVPVCGFALRIHNFGVQGPKRGKIAPEIGKSHCKQKTQITRKRCEIRKKVLLTTYRKLGPGFQKTHFFWLP